MLTNRLRKIGSDFAVLFSAVPRRDMSSLGFRNSVMEKENFHIDLGHYKSSESNLFRKKDHTLHIMFLLIVLWQLYKKSFSRFVINRELFPLYESILFQFLPETSQEKSRIGSKIDGINIYILLVQEEDCTMREAQRGQSLPIRQEDSKFEILSR
ncbi:hypothetical protein ACJX0J_005113 [Zea mays]